MSSKLVYISNDNYFTGLEPEEGCFDGIGHCALSCLYDNVELSGQVSTHPVVVSPQSVADNHPLREFRSQQPQQKDHGGFMKSDVHHVYVQISSCCDESSKSHRLLELEVTICGIPITCLIDSSSTHHFIDRKTLDKIGLRDTIGDTLEVVLVDDSKILVDNVCHIPIQFKKQIR